VDAKAQFRSLAEPWADTGTSTGRLMLAVPWGLARLLPSAVRVIALNLSVKESGRPMAFRCDIPVPHHRTIRSERVVYRILAAAQSG